MEDDNQLEHNVRGGGNFLSGLLFGAVAGAVGYFLFGTEKGKQTRQKLNKEWEGAKDKLVEEGVIVQDASLQETVQGVIQHVIEPPKRRMPPRKTSTTKKKTDKKFKGV